MATHQFLLLAFAFLLAPGQAQTGSPTNEAEKLFRSMEKKLGSAKTLKLHFDGTAETLGEFKSVKMKGSLILGEGNKSRLEASAEFNGTKHNLSTVSDGTKSIGDGPDGKISEKTAKNQNENMQKGMTHGGVLAFQFLVASDKEGNQSFPKFNLTGFKLGKKEKVGQRDAQVIEYDLTMADGSEKEKGMKFAESIWIDVETHVPLKRVFKGKVEKQDFKLTEIYSDMTLNPTIDSKLFEMPK